MKGSTNAQPMAQQGTGPQNMGLYGGGNSFGFTKASSRFLNDLNMLIPMLIARTGMGGGAGTGSKGTMQPSNSNYASGGNVRPEKTSSVEDDIEAAIRLARMIGRLTEKL